MMALWLVRSILCGPLKIRVNFKLLHGDCTLFRLKLILNKIKHHGKLDYPTDHLGGPLGRPDDL